MAPNAASRTTFIFSHPFLQEHFAPRRETQNISSVYFYICVFPLFSSLPAASHSCLSLQCAPCQIVPPPRHTAFQKHQVPSGHSWPPLSLGSGLRPISPGRRCRCCISPSSPAHATPEARSASLCVHLLFMQNPLDVLVFSNLLAYFYSISTILLHCAVFAAAD